MGVIGNYKMTKAEKSAFLDMNSKAEAYGMKSFTEEEINLLHNYQGPSLFITELAPLVERLREMLSVDWENRQLLKDVYKDIIPQIDEENEKTLTASNGWGLMKCANLFTTGMTKDSAIKRRNELDEKRRLLREAKEAEFRAKWQDSKYHVSAEDERNYKEYNTRFQDIVSPYFKVKKKELDASIDPYLDNGAVEQLEEENEEARRRVEETRNDPVKLDLAIKRGFAVNMVLPLNSSEEYSMEQTAARAEELVNAYHIVSGKKTEEPTAEQKVAAANELVVAAESCLREWDSYYSEKTDVVDGTADMMAYYPQRIKMEMFKRKAISCVSMLKPIIDNGYPDMSELEKEIFMDVLSKSLAILDSADVFMQKEEFRRDINGKYVEDRGLNAYYNGPGYMSRRYHSYPEYIRVERIALEKRFSKSRADAGVDK